MEDIVKNLINGNNRYQWEILQENERIGIDHRIPKLPFLILTCMNPRLDVHRIFQLEPGDAFVLRNAGNQYTEDVLRSILIAIHEYSVKFIVVLGHLDCGMRKIRLDKLRTKLSPQVLLQIGQSSINYQFAIQRFFKTFADEITNISNQVDRLKKAKGIPSDIKVIGMLYDPSTGWIFPESEFKKYTSYRNFMQNYQKLLRQKRMAHIDYLETIESEIVESKPIELGATIEKPETVENVNEIVEENEDFNLSVKIGTEAEFKEIQSMLEKNAEVIENSMKIVSKVQIPKIFIPKIRVHIPKVNKYKKED
jgi:carbonic anhydrase